ncbi:MAG: YdcF family protein [Alphaproteobacteria bacterium]|nr:YdcF family protein [Alphaproteobacteria bacterium]MCD8526316.1 YdcF family protein [Alphaproteobacteria bacterium]MCD8571524.1 YdcF family protein [Alphaproteobacteria bacterium]
MFSSVRFILWCLFTLIFIWLAGYAAFVLKVIDQKPSENAQTTDAIIVLTGGNFRVDTGFELFAEKRAPRLFITGVHETATLDDLVREWKGLDNGSRALPACCMAVGHKALTTIENAEETREWIAMEKDSVKSLQLVTSPYHMPRAVLEFRSLMPGIEIIPHPVMRDTLGPRDEFFWHITFMEYHKWLVRFLQLSVRPQ